MNQELTHWIQEQLVEVEKAYNERLAQLQATDPTLIVLQTSRANLLNILKQAEITTTPT